MRRLPCLTIAGLFLLGLTGHAQSLYRPVRDPNSPAGIPYTRYFTRDKLGRRITFYVHGDQAKRLPLVLSVLGSGAYSNFIKIDGQIRDGHRIQREVFGERAHVLIVEKPGIEFLEQHSDPGRAHGASREFLHENTLDRWAEAVSAALQAASSLPLADPTRRLAVGHSEGATIVSMVAARQRDITHVAALSGSGPVLLYQLMLEAREGRLYRDQSSDPEKQWMRLMDDLERIRKDPTNNHDPILGHTAYYWSSRWRVSPMEELAKTKARIFLAHGTADRNEDVSNFDMLFAHLKARGADVTGLRLEGADHGFGYASQPQRQGWKEVFTQVRDWFFQPIPRAK